MGYWKQFYGTGRRAPKAAAKVIDVQIYGEENLHEILQQLPEQFTRKPITAAFRKGAQPLIKEIRANSVGSLKKAAKIRASKKVTAISVGFSGKGSYMPSYFKAYWSNYGTLENRASFHAFKYERKAKSAHMLGGIQPRLVVEKAWDRTKSVVKSLIDELVYSMTMDYLKKNAAP